MTREEEELKHPAFGLVSFRRTTGGGQRFYGSEIPVDHYITLEVTESVISRDLTDDRFRSGLTKDNIVRVRMTPNQFSELITSMNIGEGIPCTIEYRENKSVEKLPEMENRKEFVHRKFSERMKEFADSLKSDEEKVRTLTAKKTLTKKDQEDINWIISHAIQEVKNNIPFFAKCFQETVDKVVLDAKSEVDAAILHKVTTLGLQALHEQNKLLKDGEV